MTDFGFRFLFTVVIVNMVEVDAARIYFGAGNAILAFFDLVKVFVGSCQNFLFCWRLFEFQGGQGGCSMLERTLFIGSDFQLHHSTGKKQWSPIVQS